MYRTLLFIVAFTGFGLANAQMIVAPIKQKYWASSSELIFSFGNVEDPNLDVNNVLRFSCFLHVQEQLHYNFTNHVGVFTGLSLRNVGFIND